MLFYPIFIPIYPGGGRGGGGGGSPIILLIPLIIFGGVGIILSKSYKPDFQMKIIHDDLPHIVVVKIRKQNYPSVKKITHKNIEGLKEKGYTIYNYTDNYTLRYDHIWHNIIDISTKYYLKNIDITKDKLIEDCKECDVYTEIIYNYNTIFGNEKQAIKKLYWSKHYVEELK